MSPRNESAPDRPGTGVDAVYRGIVVASRSMTYLFLLAMMLIMALEVVMRYAVGSPLGWNVSLIEKVLLPGLVFLGLPWAYAAGSHVAAEMVYDRLPDPVRAGLRWLTTALLIACCLVLAYAGTLVVIEAFQLGSRPPPLSSQLPISTWVWRAFMPLGALLMLLLVLLDLARSGRGESGHELDRRGPAGSGEEGLPS